MTEIIQTCPSDLVITVDKWRVSRSSNEHEHRHVLSICPIWSPIELQMNLRNLLSDCKTSRNLRVPSFETLVTSD